MQNTAIALAIISFYFLDFALTSGSASGNSWLNGFFFLNGSARMYSRDRWDIIAQMSSSDGVPSTSKIIDS